MASTEQQERDKLWEMIGEHEVAMLTTRDGNVLRSRPMFLHPDRHYDALWFFTSTDDHLVDEVRRANDVNIALQDEEQSHYVSLSGNAEVINDREKMAQLWSPEISRWYAHLKVDAPDTRLVRVRLVQGQYWDEEARAMSRMWEMARAGVAGEKPDLVETDKVSMTRHQNVSPKAPR